MINLMLAPEPPQSSFFEELRDGSAGAVVRLVINIALGIALTGFCTLLAYLLAAIVPEWGRGVGWGGSYPSDELVAILAVLCAGAFLVGTLWLWLPKGRWRGVVRPTMYTVAIAAFTIILCIWAEGELTGDDELVIFGLIMVGIAGTILVWIPPLYRMSRGRPVVNTGDGLANVHCPACNYRMVGLHESRCPECGASYTLDELLAKQDFAPTARRSATLDPPPVTSAHSGQPSPTSE